MIRFMVAVPIGAIGVVNVVAFWLMPRLTRPDLYFAVTAPPGFRDGPEGRSILRHYRIELILFSALWLMVFVAGVYWLGAAFIPGGFFLLLFASFLAFYRARRRVLPHAVSPTTIREASLHPVGPIIPGGWVAASGPFLLLAACAAYLWIHWEEIPARFVIHWRNGQPDGWAVRSFASVFLPFLSTVGILAAFTLILYGTAHWVRPIHAGGPEGARELRFRRIVSGIVLAAEYLITLQSSWIVLSRFRHLGLKPGPPLGSMFVFFFPLLFVVIVVIVLVRLGQGGSRAPAANGTPSSASAVPIGDRTQDSYWTLGIFYFNRDDPAVVVEKRFGIGYTLNFARPITWIIVLLVLMSPLVTILVARWRR